MRFLLSPLLAAVVTFAIPGATAAEDVTRGPADRLPPRPVEVGDADEFEEGVIAAEPPVVWLHAAPGEAVQPTLTITNGGEAEVGLQLTLLDVAADERGRPLPVGPDTEMTPGLIPSAADWVTLAEDQIWIDTAERAWLRPTLAVPDDTDPGARVAALLASTEDAAVEVVVFLAVEVIEPGTEPEPATLDIDVTMRQRGTVAALTVTFVSSGLTAAEGTARIDGWWGGTLTETDLPPILLLPGSPRLQRVEFSLPRAPGPYRVEVGAETADGTGAEGRDRTWLWDPTVALIAAVVLLVVAVWLVTRALRRHRKAQPAAPPLGSSDEEDGGDS
jgi:hypothetical protein